MKHRKALALCAGMRNVSPGPSGLRADARTAEPPSRLPDRLIEQRAARLTPREKQVAELLLAGKRSKQIAAALGVSRRTVEVYRSRLLEKMQVESATALVVTLLRAHLAPSR